MPNLQTNRHLMIVASFGESHSFLKLTQHPLDQQMGWFLLSIKCVDRRNRCLPAVAACVMQYQLVWMCRLSTHCSLKITNSDCKSESDCVDNDARAIQCILMKWIHFHWKMNSALCCTWISKCRWLEHDWPFLTFWNYGDQYSRWDENIFKIRGKLKIAKVPCWHRDEIVKVFKSWFLIISIFFSSCRVYLFIYFVIYMIMSQENLNFPYFFTEKDRLIFT